MILSTSTNLLFLRPDGCIVPIGEAMERLANAGFTDLDMNYYDWATTPGSPYIECSPTRWIDDVLEAQARLNVSFRQSHAYFFDFADPNLSADERAGQETQVRRSVEYAACTGTRVLVMHPCTVYGTDRLFADSKELCRRYFSELLEQTHQYGIVFALENMVESNISPKRKYCAYPEELVDLVDSFGDTRIGVCWDFEHGDLMQQDQPQIIRMLGKRLRATHVSEQHGFDPSLKKLHRLPMSGNIEWEPIMQALYGIGYEDCFSFEAHNYINFLPDTCIEPALRIAYLVGKHLVELAGKKE